MRNAPTHHRTTKKNGSKDSRYYMNIFVFINIAREIDNGKQIELVCKHEKNTPDDIVASIYTMAIPMFVKSLRFSVSHTCDLTVWSDPNITLCYHCNTPEIFDIQFVRWWCCCCYCATSLCKLNWTEPNRKKKSKPRLLVSFYVHMIEAQLCVYMMQKHSECGLILDYQTKSLINVIAQNFACIFIIANSFLLESDLLHLLRAISVYFFLLHAHWPSEFEIIEPMLGFIIKIVTD